MKLQLAIKINRPESRELWPVAAGAMPSPPRSSHIFSAMLHMAIILLCTNIAQGQQHGPVGAHRSNVAAC